MAKTATISKSKSTRKKTTPKAKSPATKTKPTTKVAKAQTRRADSGKAAAQKAAEDKPIRTYTQAMEFLNGLVNFEKRPPSPRARNPMTLDRTRRLLAELGNPEKQYKTVHIAGSKGKGSTATMLAKMLQGNGMKVGIYTSPHLMDIRERIVINGEQISTSNMAKLIAQVAELAKADKEGRPTFFEVLTVVALKYFADQKVDIAVVETGLGGRLDATNAITPEVCAMTSISIDHTQLLGSSIEKIAEEKAGIFKEDVPVVSAPQMDGVKRILKKNAAAAKTPLLFAGDDISFSYRFESSRASGPQARICVTTKTSHFDHLAVPLVGKHQAINCGVAIGVLDQLKNRGLAIDDEAAVSGLAQVTLEGRMEMLCENPRVIGDAAHNAASIDAVMRAIGQNIPYDSMVVIFGCCQDKDVEGMLKHITLGADKIIFTGIKTPRAADPNELAIQFAELSGRMAQVAKNLNEALEIAQKAVTREDLICVTGSFYLVSEAKKLFAKHPHRVVK